MNIKTLIIAFALIIAVIVICDVKAYYTKMNIFADSENSKERKEGYYPYYGRYNSWYPYFGYGYGGYGGYGYMPWYYYPLTPYILW